jgi:hypothetical protein
MAKLSQLLTLERMLNAYDNMNFYDAQLANYQAICINGLLDITIAKLIRQLNSKTPLSCRNVLVANFETMTKTAHWLKCRLFTDLPEAMGMALREKIVQMVDLLKALMVKIIDVDEFAERFFERLKKRYRTRRTTDYELWKARQSKITIKRLVRYQVDLTAEMLSNGILMYAEAPNGEEIQNVDKDKLALTMTDKNEITETFINECAKLRRYSHWEGDRFVIDYPLLRKYLFCVFGKLNSDQHIQMFEYDVQMKQIHEDIERLRKEERLIEEKKEGNGNLMSRMRRTIDTMRQEGELKHLYDYTWLMMAMNENCDLPSFDTPTSFREYLINIGIKKGIPNRSTISKYYDKARGQLPNWTFDDADGTEAIRRNNVGKRFLNLVKRE